MDLSNLSRDEKLRALDVLAEKERRLRERRAHYKPNEGQALVHSSEKPFRWVFAGNGSGKTALAVNEVVWRLDGYNGHTEKILKAPTRVVVVLDAPAKVDDVWLPELNKWAVVKPEMLDKRGKPYVSRIKWPNGSELLFMFVEQEPMLFESLEADFVCFDEPPKRSVYIALLRGLRKAHSQPGVLVVGTPIAAPWMRKEVYEPWARGEMDDTECFKFASDVNRENVNWEFVEKNIFTKYSDKELRMRRFGEFFDLEGLALAHLFDRARHVVQGVKWPHNWPVVIAIDPHPRKNHVAVMIGVTPQDELVVLKELTSPLPPSEFADQLKDFYQGYAVIDIICDSFGSGDTTGGQGALSFIQVLRNKGIRVRPTTRKEKDDEAWIQSIQEVLLIPDAPDNMGEREPRLKVVAACKGVVSDIESVEWERYKNADELKPKLAMHSKDFLVCVKYALASQPQWRRASTKPIRPSGPVTWNASKDRRPVKSARAKQSGQSRGGYFRKARGL